MKEKRKEEMLNEFKLRRLIKKALKIKQMKKNKADAEKFQEEKKLRSVLQYLIQEGDIDADGEPAPYASTAVNALADAFNQILPVLKSGLRKLAKPEERESYRAHFLEKFKSIFGNFEGLDVAPEGAVGESDINEQEGGGDTKLKLTLDDDDRIMPSDGKEDARFIEKEKKPEEKQEEDFEMFQIAGKNPTGARVAFETINDSNIEQVLSDKRKLVAFDPEYKEEFKNYALYNADLWLITYEKELADAMGQEPAFTTTEMPKPSGAEVRAPASEFEGAGEEETGLPKFEDEGMMEEDLEEIFME